jgi:hypothetical protein
MNTIAHLRGVPALRALRGHRPAVVVCRDDPDRLTARRLEMRCEECPQSRVDMAPHGGPE